MPAYVSSRYTYEGTETTEISITRVGGAIDPTGQAQSRKIVTSPYSQWLRPFTAEPYAVWNTVVGSPVTVTVCGISSYGATPNSDDLFMEVEYLGSGSSPLGTVVSTTKADVLAAGAPAAADGSSWNNAGSGSMPSTWDPATISVVTLSGGNLVVTSTSTTTDQGARSVTAAGAGKYYFEVTFSTFGGGGNTGVGAGTIQSSYANMGTNATSGVLVFGSGTIWSNGASTGNTLGARATGNVIGIAIDLDNRMAWFRVAPAGNWNGVAGANPATNTGGVAIPPGTIGPVCTFNAAGNVFTANFGASAFSGAVPAGFASGWIVTLAWVPFKLTKTLNSPAPGMAGYIHARVRAAKPGAIYYIDPQITLS